MWCEFFMQVNHSREYALITEFSNVKSLICAPVTKPEDPDNSETAIPNLPWLDITHCKCNCSNFPEKGHVLINKEEPNIYSNTLSSCSGNANNSTHPDSTVDESSEEETVLYAERFKLRGGTFHEFFQLALKTCQLKWANKD